MTMLEYNKNDIIYKKNSEAEHIYFIKEGEI